MSILGAVFFNLDICDSFLLEKKIRNKQAKLMIPLFLNVRKPKYTSPKELEVEVTY